MPMFIEELPLFIPFFIQNNLRYFSHKYALKLSFSNA